MKNLNQMSVIAFIPVRSEVSLFLLKTLKILWQT